MNTSKPDLTIDERVGQLMIELLNDRVGFVKHIIGATPTDQQAEALQALDEYDDVMHKAGHGTGKSTDMAWCVLHFLMTRPFSRVIATAPSKHQLSDVLWAELAQWHRKMESTSAGKLFADMFEWRRETFQHKEYGNDWFAAARSVSKENSTALQGRHGKYLLKLVDEAPGMSEEILEVVDGATGSIETKCYMTGNPTKLSGTFFNAFHKDKDSGIYKLVTSSCLKSPIVPAKYIEKMRRKYGEDSNIWRVRVLGEFPLEDGDSFIPYEMAASAVVREIEPQIDQPSVLGVDVGRGGDPSCIAHRQGDLFHPYQVVHYNDTMRLVAKIADYYNKVTPRPKHIFIDSNGLGAGVFDRLREMGYPVTGVNVSEVKPMMHPERYSRLRDELWGLFRDWLEQMRGKIWDDDEASLVGELTTPQYEQLSSGVIKIESKRDMKSRGLASPNIADAHIMCFAMPVSSYAKDDEYDNMADVGNGQEPLDSEAGY